MTDVLGFGVVSVDEVLYVDAHPSRDGKAPVRDWFRRCGGLTGMALQAAARLGSVARYAGCLGDDQLSREVETMLVQSGVDVSKVVRSPDARPYHSVVAVDAIENSRAIFFDGRASGGAHPVLPTSETIVEARVILVDGHGLDGMVRAARVARAAGSAVVGDFENPDRDTVDELVSLVDHLLVSAPTARELTGTADPAAAVHQLWRADRKCVAVTNGSAGVWYTDESSARDVLHLPAYQVNAVDTTGCGDVFHGAYAHAIAHGASVQSALRFASAAAAALATHGGADRLAPDKATVESLIASSTHPAPRPVALGGGVVDDATGRAPLSGTQRP